MPITITYEGGSVVFADATGVPGFTQGAAAKYWLHRPVGARRYAKEKTSAPSNDGSLVQRHGFRSMPIGPIVLMYVNTSDDNCLSAFIADRNAIENKKVSIAIPGWGTLSDCDVNRFEADPPKSSGAALSRMRCVLELVQDRLT